MEFILLSISTIFALSAVSGFLAGAETAITGISQATIYRLKQEGDKRAKIVSKLRANKEKLVSALLLCTCACHSFVITRCDALLTHTLGEELGEILTPIIMTIFLFIFAEMVPKTYAFEHAEKYALTTAPILIRLFKLLYPLVSFIQIIVDYILSKFTKKDLSGDGIISATEELRGTIDLHHHEGSMVKTDRDMLGSILDLKDTEVAEVMVHRSSIISLNIDQPILDIMQQALNSNHTRLPMWQGTQDNIIGILNIKDLLKAIHSFAGNLSKINVKELLTAPWFIPEATVLSEQLHEFRLKRNHFALVIDEYGGLLGLVTLEDILEVIVGQIEDEHDKIDTGIITIDDGSYMIEGTVSIRDINRELDWNLPTEDATTLAGLIMHETEKVPAVGDVFEFHSIKFTIVVKHYNQIKVVQAQLLNSDSL